VKARLQERKGLQMEQDTYYSLSDGVRIDTDLGAWWREEQSNPHLVHLRVALLRFLAYCRGLSYPFLHSGAIYFGVSLFGPSATAGGSVALVGALDVASGS